MRRLGFAPVRGTFRLPRYILGAVIVRVCHGVWPSRADVREALIREFFPLYYDVTRGERT